MEAGVGWASWNKDSIIIPPPHHPAAADRNTDWMRSVVLAWYHGLALSAVPGRPRTIGPLLAFGPTSVLVSSSSRVTWCFWTIGATELPVLIWRAFVEVSQIALIVSNYQRPTGCMTQLGTHYTVSAGPESLQGASSSLSKTKTQTLLLWIPAESSSVFTSLTSCTCNFVAFLSCTEARSFSHMLFSE